MDIDLKKHAVVEASAGTGKTFTIERLVLRLLFEEKVGLDEILLVTFTEKATGELKSRIRLALETRLREQPEQRDILTAALDVYDQAPIFTIHGFCQRLLAEYALEQGQELRRQHVQDDELFVPALREVQRRIWRQEFGPDLKRVLELAEYNRAGAEKWERKLRDLARRYRPECGHVLLPDVSGDDGMAPTRLEQCRAAIAKVRGLAGPIPAVPATHAWHDGFRFVNVHASTKAKLLGKFVEPLLVWLKDEQTEAEPLRAVMQFFDRIEESFKDFAEGGFAGILVKVPQRQLDEFCRGLTAAAAELDSLRATGAAHRLVHQLAVKTIGAVRATMADMKNQRGQVSFDDMIADVDRALDPANPRARGLVDLLARRFRYGIVDEFQDTDVLQWQIFRRLFLEPGRGKLIVVGDPKQAIFGFRGADLPTYLQAASDMETQFAAARYPLVINWRTADELLQPLNRLFEHGNWFAADAGIPYVPVQAPPLAERRSVLTSDPLGRPALAIVEVRKEPTLILARKKFARFAAEECVRLLEAGIEFVHKGERKQLNAGHICLLVFKRNESDPLVQALRERGVPYSFYKQYGLWKSTEAEHLGIILQALAAPDDRTAFRKALLTSFFRLKPKDLALCATLPPAHPARELFDRWLGYADRRQWSALSRSLLADTGILFHDLDEQDPATSDLDRRAGNLRYLLATLEEAAYRDNLDLLDLVDFYESKQCGGDDPQADLQPIETEEPKVQIMTVHACKGLEYPVVFLAGGYTQRAYEDLADYRDAEGRRVFDLDPDRGAKQAMTDSQRAEQRRLLYVALTRAMLKLYVPLVGAELGNKPHAGPVATILAPAVSASTPWQLGPQHAAVIEAITIKKHGVKKPAEAPDAAPAEAAEQPAQAAVALAGELFPVLDGDLRNRRVVVKSFSSLHRAALQAQGPQQFGDDTARADDEGPDVPDDPFRGAVFGEIVHEVLEAIDFTAVGRATGMAALVQEGSALRAVLDAPIHKHVAKLRSRVPPEKLLEGCRLRVADLVWRALRTPLTGLDVPLCTITPAERIHELAFLFPRRPGEEPPAEVQAEDEFFTGFMDLVYRKDGRYYLLDWKTNTLEAYDEAAIARAMDDSDYRRQYRLYLHALRRWLERLHGRDFDFLKNFGGVHYLFLRGMNEQGHGVFFARPTTADFDWELVTGLGRM